MTFCPKLGCDIALEQVESPTVGVWASRMLTVSTMLSAASMVVLTSVREQVSQSVIFLIN